MTVVWSWQAVTDLVEIRAFVLRSSPEASAQFLRLIRETADDVERFPRMGRPGKRKGEREKPLPATPWILVYRVQGQVVQVIRVSDGRREPRH